jgi:hypothetical protein
MITISSKYSEIKIVSKADWCLQAIIHALFEVAAFRCSRPRTVQRNPTIISSIFKHIRVHVRKRINTTFLGATIAKGKKNTKYAVVKV